MKTTKQLRREAILSNRTKEIMASSEDAYHGWIPDCYFTKCEVLGRVDLKDIDPAKAVMEVLTSMVKPVQAPQFQAKNRPVKDRVMKRLRKQERFIVAGKASESYRLACANAGRGSVKTDPDPESKSSQRKRNRDAHRKFLSEHKHY